MKNLNEVTGKEVLDKYCVMYNQAFDNKEDYRHFTKAFDAWIVDVINGKEYSLSLNKVNYLGAKTRALLAVIGLKEPKTLTDLKNILYKN